MFPIIKLIVTHPLKSRLRCQCMVKYSDYATLLVPDVQLQQEFNSIMRWSSDNRLTTDMSTIKELVFHRPNNRNHSPPSYINGIKWVSFVKLLRVWLQDLGISRHVHLIHIWNQRFYLLNQLKSRIYLQMRLRVFLKHLYRGLCYRHQLLREDMRLPMALNHCKCFNKGQTLANCWKHYISKTLAPATYKWHD